MSTLEHAKISGKARLFQEYEKAVETAEVVVGGETFSVNGSLVDYARFSALERAMKVRNQEIVCFRDSGGVVRSLSAVDYSSLVDGLACAGVDSDIRLQECYSLVDNATTPEEINLITY